MDLGRSVSYSVLLSWSTEQAVPFSQCVHRKPFRSPCLSHTLKPGAKVNSPRPPPSFKLSHVRHFISTLRKVMTIRLQQYERWGTYTLRPQRKKDRLTRSLLQQRELRKSAAHLRMSCLGSSCGLWTALGPRASTGRWTRLSRKSPTLN